MKKSLLLALAPIAISVLFANVANANAVFDKNCASCHAGGKNVMNPDKTLSKESLEKNGVNNLADIKALVTKGKPPMPGFQGALDDAAIADVSAFVLEQSKKGW